MIIRRRMMVLKRRSRQLPGGGKALAERYTINAEDAETRDQLSAEAAAAETEEQAGDAHAELEHGFAVDIDQLSAEEPLSPELVLVLSPELRSEALARLAPPVWPTPRPRAAIEPPAPAVEPPAPVVHRLHGPSLPGLLVARVGQLGLIFVAVTILILAMALVANAMR